MTWFWSGAAAAAPHHLLILLCAWRAHEESARVAGIPVRLCNRTLAVLTAVAVVAAMRVVGVLLVAALMVVPVAASRQLARSFRGTLVGAVGFGIASVVAGLVASRAWDLAPGGTIVLTAIVGFAVSLAVAAARRRSFAPGRGQQTRTTEG